MTIPKLALLVVPLLIAAARPAAAAVPRGQAAAAALATAQVQGSVATAVPAEAANDGAPGQVVAIDVTHTPFRVSGGVRGFRPKGATGGTLDVHLRGSMQGPPDKAGELLFDLRRTLLGRVPWGNRTLVSAELRVAPAFVGEGKRNWYRSHRARLFVVDGKGKRLYLPNTTIVDRPASRDGWLALAGRPSGDVPAPLGFMDARFDPAHITGVGINVEAFNRPGEVVEGPIELRGLQVGFEAPVATRVLPPDPAILAGEAERAARMNARLAQRCGVGPAGMAVGVNLAWPTAQAPNGDELQLYGRILDGGNSWWDKLWDIGEADVAAGVRKDFHEIAATFGAGAVVRVWLLGDLRSGMTFSATGDPVIVTDRARANMQVLLDLALAEHVVLIPVLLDFGLADGVSQTGPDGAWQVNDRPDLIIDPDKRAKLVAALEDFVKSFAGHPAILAWDVMNEPENAVAVVNPGYFADLQALVRDLVDAVHRQGDLATVGHHDAPDPQQFFRGRIASDLGQAHHYPFVETRANPTPFGVKLTPTFGPLPAGWGEAQAQKGQIAAQLGAARKAGHRLFMFWSWRGHQSTGDGFAVAPYAAEIKQALAKSKPAGIAPPTAATTNAAKAAAKTSPAAPTLD